MPCYCYYAGYCCYCRRRYFRKKSSGIGSVYLAAGMIALIMPPFYLCGVISMFHRSIVHDIEAAIAFTAPWSIYCLWGTLKGSPYLGSFLIRIATLAEVAFPTTIFGATYYLVLSR